MECYKSFGRFGGKFTSSNSMNPADRKGPINSGPPHSPSPRVSSHASLCSLGSVPNIHKLFANTGSNSHRSVFNHVQTRLVKNNIRLPVLQPILHPTTMSNLCCQQCCCVKTALWSWHLIRGSSSNYI